MAARTHGKAGCECIPAPYTDSVSSLYEKTIDRRYVFKCFSSLYFSHSLSTIINFDSDVRKNFEVINPFIFLLFHEQRHMLTDWKETNRN